MYHIIDSHTKNIVEESLNPTWVKQQKLVDRPILARNYNEADGVVLSDGDTMLGIEGRNMQNYTPTVLVEEVNSDVYILAEMDKLKSQIVEVQNGVKTVYDVQTEGTVPKTELDNAYAEGVNSIE